MTWKEKSDPDLRKARKHYEASIKDRNNDLLNTPIVPGEDKKVSVKEEMTLRLKNKSKYIGQKGQTNWWEWTVFLEADEEKELDDIQYVIYHLHRTFTPPIVKVTTKTGGFPLTRKGWGTFVITAKVVFKSKKDPLILEHELEFQNTPVPAPRKP